MRVRILLFLLALALVLPSASSAPALAQAAPYEINAILVLTGAAAFIGSAELKSLQILEEVTNKAGGIKGRPIKFVWVDDQSNPRVSVQLTNELIAKKVPVIVGPTYTATCLADGPPLAKTGPVDHYAQRRSRARPSLPRTRRDAHRADDGDRCQRPPPACDRMSRTRWPGIRRC